MIETTPLSEQAKDLAAIEIGQIDLTLCVPAIAPDPNMRDETRQDEIIPAADINVQDREQEPGETDAGSTRLSIRLETARQAQKLLDDPTLGLNEKLRIMATIEKLTVGAKGRGKAKEKSKSGLFSK